MSEQWKSIPGFSRYEVSNLGHFKRAVSGKQLAGTVARNGYVHIGLLPDHSDRQVWFLAHRVVAEVFVPKPQSSGYQTVNHKNRIRTDNRADNLEWKTVADNNRDWRWRASTAQALAQSPLAEKSKESSFPATN